MLKKILEGRTDLVFDFVESGQAPDVTDEYGRSLMVWCAYYGDVSAIRYLISKGASLGELGENYDLNGAAFHGHTQLCAFLLEQGADPNYLLSDTGESALHAVLTKANRQVNHAIVQLLLQNGANPNARTNAGVETDGFMRDVRTRQETPLHRAAAFGDLQTIQLLLDAGADRTIKDMNGDTPLSWASWYLRPREILALLCYGEYFVHS